MYIYIYIYNICANNLLPNMHGFLNSVELSFFYLYFNLGAVLTRPLSL